MFKIQATLTVVFLLCGLAKAQDGQEATAPELAEISKSLFPLTQSLQIAGNGKISLKATAILVADPEPEADWVLTILPAPAPEAEFQLEVQRTPLPATLKAYSPETRLAILRIKPLAGLPKLALNAPGTPPKPGDHISLLAGSPALTAPSSGGKLAFQEAVEENSPRVWRIATNDNDSSAGIAPGTLAHTLDGSTLGLIAYPSTPQAAAPVRVLPTSHITAFLKDVTTHGKPVNRWLGIIFEDASQAPVLVGVSANSPAATAGLQANDILLTLGSHPIATLQDLVDIRPLLPLGEPTELTYIRGTTVKRTTIAAKAR